MDFIDYGNIIVIKGSYKCNILSEILCVKAQLPAEKGGLDSKAIFIDGGDVFDPYIIADVSQQYRVSLGRTLQSIKTYRVFNISQLANLVLNLPKILNFFNSKLVVVADIFNPFNVSNMGSAEAEIIFNQIAYSLSKIVKEEDVTVIVTCIHKLKKPKATIERQLDSIADIIINVKSSSKMKRLELTSISD